MCSAESRANCLPTIHCARRARLEDSTSVFVMATLEYVQIPPYATRLSPNSHRAQPKVESSLPSPLRRASTFKSPASPINVTTIGGQAISLLPQLLLSSVNIPADAPGSEGTKQPANGVPSPANSRIISKTKLLSSRDPLSIPISTANFRRFVAKVGPVFWLQDRVEEIILWRRGWRVTGSWMALYAFLCTSNRPYCLYNADSSYEQATFLDSYCSYHTPSSSLCLWQHIHHSHPKPHRTPPLRYPPHLQLRPRKLHLPGKPT